MQGTADMVRVSGIVSRNEPAGWLALSCRRFSLAYAGLLGSSIKNGKHRWFFGSGASRSRASSTVVDVRAWVGGSVGGNGGGIGVGAGSSGGIDSWDYPECGAERSSSGAEPNCSGAEPKRRQRGVG
jgi:hypothetical protein